MTQLSRDLRYSLSELYDSVRLVEKYPKWSDFADREFEVRGTQGGVSDAVRIAGKDMSRDEVRREVLYLAPKGPALVQSQRARIIRIFKSEDCGGDTRKVEICGHHFGDFVFRHSSMSTSGSASSPRSFRHRTHEAKWYRAAVLPVPSLRVSSQVATVRFSASGLTSS